VNDPNRYRSTSTRRNLYEERNQNEGRSSSWNSSNDDGGFYTGRAGAEDEAQDRSAYGSSSRSGYGAYGTRPYGSNSGRFGAAQGTSYSGRGPKGYTRSDDRIREDVCERLSENDEVDASDIEVQVKDRKVTLSGSVENRRMKHIAEDLAEAVSGVDDVDNRVTVRKTLFKDIADRVAGNESEQHYANSGTKNAPASGVSSTGASTTGLQGTSGRS